MFGNIYDKTTPGQLYHIGSEGLNCELAEPAEELRSHIYYYWLIQVGHRAVELQVIPDAATDLVVSPDLPDFSCVYLPTTEVFTIPLQGPISYTGISFHSERATSLLSATLDQIRCLEQGLETTGTLGLTTLVQSVSGETRLDDIRYIFDQFFKKRLTEENDVSHFDILDKLVENLEPASITEIAKRVGMSERQFRRTSSNLTGLSPKQLQRIMRLQTSLHAMFDQYALPETHSFYDDSHKIREIKQLTGLTPGQIKKLAEKYNS